MAVYSGTPLAQTRGIKADHTILLANARTDTISSTRRFPAACGARTSR